MIAAINAISGQTGVIASDGGSSVGGVKLTAADGRNIAVTATGALTTASTGVAGVGAGSTNYGKFTLTSSKAISVTGNATNLANAGVNAGTLRHQTAYTLVDRTAFGTGFRRQRLQDQRHCNRRIAGFVGYQIVSSNRRRQAAPLRRRRQSTRSRRKPASLQRPTPTRLSGAAMTNAAAQTGTFTINGIATASITTSATDTADTRAAVISAINAISGPDRRDRYRRRYIGKRCHAGRSRRPQRHRYGNRHADLGNTGMAGGCERARHYGTFTLSSAKSFTVSAGTTARNSATRRHGRTKAPTAQAAAARRCRRSTSRPPTAPTTRSPRSTTRSLRSTAAVRTWARFKTASPRPYRPCNRRRKTCPLQRAGFTDTDFAAETATLTRGQILQQAGTAMLAQANSLPNGVLALLRG